MNIAIIDLGTNTFHLLIAEIKPTGDYKIIWRERKPVRIGEGGFKNKIIQPEAISRGMQALTYFHSLSARYQVQEFYLIGTSMLRNAKNRHFFVDLIHKEFGFKTRIIDGEEESALIYKGVSGDLNLCDAYVLIMDIGGGSVEFIIANNSHRVFNSSYEIGVQRLKDIFRKNDPMQAQEITEITQYLEQILFDLVVHIKKYRPTQLIGSAGSFGTLLSLHNRNDKGYINSSNDDKITNNHISLSAFTELYALVMQKTYTERKEIDGMPPSQANMIDIAFVLMNHVLNIHKFQNIRVATYSLKEGVLFSILDNSYA